MPSSLRPEEAHDFAVNRSQYTFARFTGLDEAGANTRQRPRPAQAQAQKRVYDDSPITGSSEVDRLHRRHESSHAISSQILDLVSATLPPLPKQPPGSIRQLNDDHSVTQLPRVPPNGQPHAGSRDEVLGRHMSQLSGFQSAADKRKLHKRHLSLASRQRFLGSSNRLVSPTSLVAMQDLQSTVSPSDTRIFVHGDDDDGYGDLTTEKDTPLLGTLPSPSPTPSTHRSLAFWLILYFCFNLGLTLYNKGVLIHFPFPYTLTALHALCGTFGGLILLKNGAFVPAKLSDVDNLALVAFSVLYTINIAVSNISLQLVTIPVSCGIPCINLTLMDAPVSSSSPRSDTNLYNLAFYVLIRHPE
jgi:hypothetical protein